MNRKFLSLLITIAVFTLLSGGAFSEIYKWTDENGKAHFSSRPPPQGEAEIVEPRIFNIYSSPDQSSGAESESESEPQKKKAKKKKVVMYSAVWCGVCKTAKKYFKSNKIPFKEYDIETSAKGRRDYKKLNGDGVPIILVGKQRMTGFSASRFESMYGG